VQRFPASATATRALALAAVLAAAVAGCGGAASPSPTGSPTERPTPTPIARPVVTPADAAALVIASDPRFAGTIELTPDIIGASRWWTAEPLPAGGYRVVLTVGWGDCPAGCIERHTWTYDVTPAGELTLVDESGPEVPSPLPG
jgi:hypothetical protein